MVIIMLLKLLWKKTLLWNQYIVNLGLCVRVIPEGSAGSALSAESPS